MEFFPPLLLIPKAFLTHFFSLHIVNTNYLTNPSESQLIEVPIRLSPTWVVLRPIEELRDTVVNRLVLI